MKTALVNLTETQLRDVLESVLRELRRTSEYKATIPSLTDGALHAALNARADRLHEVYGLINHALGSMMEPD